MVFHTKWPSFHTPNIGGGMANNQFRCGRCRRARDLREQERHVLRGQSTALCPSTHPVAHIAPPRCACRNMGSKAGPGRRRAQCGVRRNPWGAARQTVATVPGLEAAWWTPAGAACWQARRLWVRPGTLRLMTAPQNPARLDCEHPWTSPDVAHPSSNTALESYCVFVGVIYSPCLWGLFTAHDCVFV